MSRLSALAVLIVVAACSSSSSSSSPEANSPQVSIASTIVEHDDWGDDFAAAGTAGTFVARRVGGTATHVWNPDRAEEPRLPGSTFKVLNSMIVLETDTLPDVDTEVAWDGVTREIGAWNRNHSLRSGIEVSAVWMYQEMARRIGETEMADWVRRAGYGNADTSGAIDRFWLDGELRISPVQQIDFLEQAVLGELPFRPDVVDSVLAILVRESGDGWTWAHKTGTVLADDPALGWLVGTTSNGSESWVFALNLDLQGVNTAAGQIDPAIRQQLARRFLVDLGALPS